MTTRRRGTRPPDPARIFRGQWANATDRPPAADMRAEHLADPPTGCTCLWCRELDDTDDTTPTLFDEGGD